MAITTFETLDTTSDVTTTRTLLHESIPLTGTIITDTYGTWPNEENIKNYTHGQFQSVYDYPYLSSSANHIFDITVGYDESSVLSASSGAGPTGSGQQKKKINMYNQMSQVLLGYTGSTNTVRMFELDLSLDEAGTLPHPPAQTGSTTVSKDGVFLNLSRLITKDQIKKGTFSITVGYAPWSNPWAAQRVLTDQSASDNGGTSNTYGGDYGVLYDTGSFPRGLVFYEAGIVLLSGSAFQTDRSSSAEFMVGPNALFTASWDQAIVSASISGACDAVRHRVGNISFNNTTEINSTIYFCRVPHNKYNHSGNPTYLSASTIRVKNVNTDTPIAFITTIGLYSSNSDLLAIAKLSEPLRKDPTNEMTLRVRLDY
tara:strand:+ start:18570 stop:19682 length:1113 start_codon:yes stop_codon:yes gene_type:complete